MAKQQHIKTRVTSCVNSPRLIYGTAWKGKRTSSLALQAYRAGFRAFDTAAQPRHYNEAALGQALRHILQETPRQHIFVQSKFTPLSGQDLSAQLPYPLEADLPSQVCASLTTSLRNLGINYLDSWLLHSPLDTFDNTLRAYRAMETAGIDTGKVHQLGLSNIYDLITLQRLYDSVEVKPKVLQNRFVRATGYDHEIREFCLANSMIYQSFWTLSGNLEAVQSSTAIREIAKKRGHPVAAVWFRFVLQICGGDLMAILIGTTNSQHMMDDLSVLNWTLTEDEMGSIAGLIA